MRQVVKLSLVLVVPVPNGSAAVVVDAAAVGAALVVVDAAAVGAALVVFNAAAVGAALVVVDAAVVGAALVVVDAGPVDAALVVIIVSAEVVVVGRRGAWNAETLRTLANEDSTGIVDTLPACGWLQYT